MGHLGNAHLADERVLREELRGGDWTLVDARQQAQFVHKMQQRWSDMRMGTLRSMARELGAAYSVDNKQKHDELIWTVVIAWVAEELKDRQKKLKVGDHVVIKGDVVWTHISVSNVVYEMFPDSNKIFVRRATVEEAVLTAGQIKKAD
jgi:hypothetical protein